jgi:cytochrome c-type biogenesis protein CcmF
MTSGEPGNLAVILAGAAALLSGGAFFLTATGRKNLSRIARYAFYTQTVLVAAAVVFLWHLFFSHNFAVDYVYSYSSSDLPFFYLLSAFWAGQEGTYLLWLFFSSLAGFIILAAARRYSMWAMSFLALINLFLIVMLLTLSPFRPLEHFASEGAGLNPLLQDPWMVIHPPVMFLAFGMAGIPFVISLTAMVKKDYTGWADMVFPYVLITSLALGIANVLGGYWAYKTLGWGGYWSWDPVENTSFIPWVISLGLIHSLLVEKRSGALRRTNLFLAAMIFLLILYGTFLTRSGVLADFSVHSFVDLGANAVLITFVLLFLALASAIFVRSWNSAEPNCPMKFPLYSRQFVLFIGMILMVVFGLIVLFWSSLPIITTSLGLVPAAADVPTYNTFAFPLAIFISLLLTVSPFAAAFDTNKAGNKISLPLVLAVPLFAGAALYIFKWTDLTFAATLSIYLIVSLHLLVSRVFSWKLSVSFLSGVAIAVVAFISGVHSIEYLVFIGAATAAVVASFTALYRLIPGHISLAGGQLCHLGSGFILIGILVSSAFSTSERAILPRGQSRQAFWFLITYHGTAGDITDKNSEVLLSLADGQKTIWARPQYFYSRRLNGIMKRPFIYKTVFYDLYLSPQEIQEPGNSDYLVLSKGESRKVGEYVITFIDFDMSEHAESPEISVGARLRVDHDGQSKIIIPRLEMGPSGGMGNMAAEPARLPGDSNLTISIERIYADNGAVALSIPGLVPGSSPDRLILDVSVKPGINLLWLGTIVVFIGLLLSAKRNFKK